MTRQKAATIDAQGDVTTIINVYEVEPGRAGRPAADHRAEIEGGRILAIYVTRNPDKLRHLGGQALH